ncbi:protein FAM186A [Coregonus clupeaformis]|uniref:protein FAM186A n=1 Tax=Coregonus clupeaformis TaxID=59861 RepID=UPI001BE054BA|nr:protein FAM186A [Coregonus clupeaformis]
MEEKLTMSDIDLDKILSTPQEVPHSVEVVLRKLEIAEMGRAKRDIAERLHVILNSVNKALYRTRLASAVEEEDDDLLTQSQHLEEKRRRGQQLVTIQAFLQSNLDKENELSVVLQWLRDMNQELVEVDEDFREVDGITEEWVEEMQHKIQRFMSDIQACIVRLHELCGFLFELDTRKTKKIEAEHKKGGVWHWWLESKVDARTILKIQELQPPTVDRMMADPSLATKSSTDLSFMLGDIAKSMSCNKAMSMAFKFIQTGLHNLNEALQERTGEAHKAQAQLDEMKADDCHANLARAKAELEGGKRMITELERDNYNLQEEIAAHKFQIHKLEGMVRSGQQGPVIKVIEQVMEFPMTQSQTQPESTSAPFKPKYPRRPPPSKKEQKPKIAPSVVEPQLPKSPPKTTDGTEPEPEPIEEEYVEEETYEEEIPPTPSPVSEEEIEAEPSPDELDLFEAIEKNSTSLLDGFQSSVFNIIEKSLSVQGMGLEADKANEAIKLYIILQKTIRDSFNNITSKLHGLFTDSILGLPFEEDKVARAGFWDDTTKSPGDMLKEINSMFVRHDQNIESLGANVHMLMKEDKNAKSASKKGLRQECRHSVSEVLIQLKNINNMSKQQACKMRLALERLIDMYNKLDREPKTEEEQPSTSHFSISSSDSFVEEEEIRVEKKRHHHIEKPVKVLVEKRIRRSPTPPQTMRQVLKPRLIETADQEDLERYKMEIVEEGRKIEKTVMVGATYQVNVESQRTNLKLLRQAVISGEISTELYSMAKDLITHILGMDEMRLACLLRKFMAYRSVQQVRYNLNMQLLAARELKDGQSVKEIYSFLTKLDVYQKRMLRRWSAKQAAIEHSRKTCLARMLYLFSEIRQDYNVHLLTPFLCPSHSRQHLTIKSHKLTWSLNPGCQRRLLPSPAQTPHLVMPASEAGPLSGVRQLLRGQLPTLWHCNLTMNNMQLARKMAAPPCNLSSIPLLMEIDLSRATALRSAQGRMVGGQLLLARGDV